MKQLNQYILLKHLGIGGSIIDQISRDFLLDNGYLISKLKHTSTVNANKTAQFLKKAQSYVKNTRSNLQRDLGQGHLANELMYENRLLKTLAAVNCENARQIKRLQKLVLTALPDVTSEYLFPRVKGLSARPVGDAILVGECLQIRDFNVSWDQMLNGSCYHLFPLHKPMDNHTYFLELNTRRILTHSHKINCSNRHAHFVVKDVSGVFWQHDLKTGFRKIRIQHFHHRRTHLHLTKLRGYNGRLLHYQNSQAHRTTLLHLLNQQSINLETLSDYKVLGQGNLALGLLGAVSDSITFIGKTGQEFFRTVGNITGDLVETSANGLAKVISSVGISNFVLYVLDFLIISYLVILRFQPKCCRVLLPAQTPMLGQVETVQTVPPIYYRAGSGIEDGILKRKRCRKR